MSVRPVLEVTQASVPLELVTSATVRPSVSTQMPTFHPPAGMRAQYVGSVCGCIIGSIIGSSVSAAK
jgi:hypothetical protein